MKPRTKLTNKRKRRSSNQAPRRFLNINTAQGTAELQLYGEFLEHRPVDMDGRPVQGEFIISDECLKAIERCKGVNHLTIRINSGGGDVYAGLYIYNALKKLNARKTVIVEGIAMSAATFPMCAGDDVIVMLGSIIMLHGVSTYFQEIMNLQDIQKAGRAMECMERTISAIYAHKTGLPVQELRKRMEKEWWMTPQEAIDAGFANTLQETSAEPLKLVASAGGRQSLYSGSRIISTNFEARIPQRFGIVRASNNKPETNKNMPKNEEQDAKVIQEIIEDLELVKEEITTARAELDQGQAEGIDETIQDIEEVIVELEQDIARVAEEEVDVVEQEKELETLKESLASLKAAASGGKGTASNDATEDLEEDLKNLEENIEELKKEAAEATGDNKAKATARLAVALERRRAARIDKIAKNIDPKLVAKAKATGMTAEELAYQAMESSKSHGKIFLARRRRESRAARGVRGNPNGGGSGNQDKATKFANTRNRVRSVVNRIKGRKPGDTK